MLIGVINPKLAHAQNFSGTVARSMGGAGRAAGSADSHILNPATLVHVKGYQLGYQYAFHSREQRGILRDWTINIADGNTEAFFRGGATYLNREIKVQGVKTRTENYLVSVGNFLMDNVSIGVQGQYWIETPEGVAKSTFFQSSFGVLYIPVENVGLAFVSNNFLKEHRAGVRPELGFGLHYLYEEIFRLRFDIIYPTKHNAMKKGVLMLGGESLFANDLSFHFGGRLDDIAKENWFTLGVGWDGPRLRMAYAFEKNLKTAKEIRQSFDLSLFF